MVETIVVLGILSLMVGWPLLTYLADAVHFVYKKVTDDRP